MSIDTAAAAYVAFSPAPRVGPAAAPAALPATLTLPVAEDDEPIGFNRWQAAVAMLAGLAVGALIVAVVALPW